MSRFQKDLDALDRARSALVRQPSLPLAETGFALSVQEDPARARREEAERKRQQSAVAVAAERRQVGMFDPKPAAETAPATTPQFALHPFQAAGLGKAPFTLTGYRESTFQAAPGEPVRAGSSCDYCGTAIRHVYEIRSSDGKEFKVGSECVRRTKDRQLEAAAKSVRGAVVREARARVREAADVEHKRKRAVAREDELCAAVAENEHAYADIMAGLRVVAATLPGFPADFARDVLDRLESGRITRLSEKQVELANKLIAQAQRAKARTPGEGGYTGEVGKRGTFDVTLDRRTSFESAYGRTYVYRFFSDAGHLLTWKTGTPFGREIDGMWRPYDDGDRLQIVATVKKHGEYRGEKQTELSRVKGHPR